MPGVSLDVIAGGERIDAIEASSSLGIDQDNGEATITLAQPASVLERTDIQIWAGYDGATTRVFNGEITGRGWSMTGRPQIFCQDILARLKRAWSNADRVYTLQTDNAIVQNLVEASGVDASLTHIEGAGRMLGVAQEIVLKKGDRPLELIRQIDDASGLYKTFTRANGAVYRLPIALGSPSHSFTQGDNILDGSRRSDAAGVINSVYVKGLEYQAIFIESTAQATSDYVPFPFNYNTYNLQTNLIETQVDADAVAAAILAQLNQVKNEITLTVLGDATLEPGNTISVSASRLGLGSTQLFIAGVTHNIGKVYTTTIRAMSLAGSGL